MSEYWGDSLYDSRYYDEDGFALELPQDHPARAVQSALDQLSGKEQRVKIRKDYTDEFCTRCPELVAKVDMLRVTTRDPATTPLGITLEFHVVINQEQYVVAQVVSRLDARTAEAFEEQRMFVYRKAAAYIGRTIQANWQHQWQWQPVATHPLWVKCMICGLEQDTPDGNRERGILFK